MWKHYKGRVLINREALGALFGLPEGVETRIEYDPSMDAYHLMMRSEKPVFINGKEVTVQCREGCSIPYVDSDFLTRTVIVAEEITINEAECFANALLLGES